MSGEVLDRAGVALASADLARCYGRVNNLIGLIIEATGLQAEVGEVCLVGATDRRSASDREAVPAEVVGFREGRTLLMPLGELQGIGPGTKVLPTGAPFRVPVGHHLLGRIIDGLGVPLDALGAMAAQAPPDHRTATHPGSSPEDHLGSYTEAHSGPHAEARVGYRSTVAAPPPPCSAPAFASASRSGYAHSTASSPADWGSDSASLPAPVSASPPYSA